MDFDNAKIPEDIRDLIVNSVDQVGPVREALQTLPGEGQRLFVAIDPDQVEVRKPLEQGFGVAAHSQGCVDDHGRLAPLACSFNSRGQQIDAPVLEDRYMAFGRGFWLVGIAHTFVLSCLVVPR